MKQAIESFLNCENDKYFLNFLKSAMLTNNWLVNNN